MMYVIFNNQGAIKEKQINEWIVQGSNNTNKIGVVIEGTDSTSYAIVGVCKLPNGEVITTTPSVEQAQIKDGVYGVVFSLTEDITALAGTLRINLQAINVNTDKVITSYTVFLCVNEGVDPGEILMMTAQQYQDLISKIELDVQQDETILTFNTRPEAENYSLGQIIYVKNENKLYECVENESEEHVWHETFDFNNYYTKAETDDLLNTKQDKLTNALPTAQLQYAVGFDSQGNLRKGQGGGGATYTAGTGIEISNFTISVDTDYMATKSYVFNHYATKSSVESIEAKIPAQASSSNKLADKDFVNSSIATNTATFRGTYNVVTDLGLTTDATEQQIASAIASKLSQLGITYDNNDYVYVAFPNATVSTQFDKYDRYKFNGTSWEYEYTLNNSSFTAEQWAAINSGITSGLLSQLARESEIADAYSNQATYSVGQYCIYNNTLYRCTTAVSTPEDFDSTKWTACKLADVMVDLDSNQTIMGEKTFGNINGLKIKNSNSTNLLEIYVNKSNYLNGVIAWKGTTVAYFGNNSWFNFACDAVPDTNNFRNLGRSGSLWKDLYLSGKIKDGTSEFNADNVFNVINASDIVNNTLTQAQYNLITNGKPTLIKGTFLGYISPVLFNPNRESVNNHFGTIIGSNTTTQEINEYYISPSKVVILNPPARTLKIIAGVGDFKNVNGKNIPAYKTDTTKQYKFVQKVGGNLDYLPDYAQPYATNSTTTLQYETINNISISADTTYTLATAPANTYPEYKGYISNSSGSSKTITLPTSVTKIKASSSLTVVQPTISGGSVTTAGTVSIPDGAYVEFSIMASTALLLDWNEQ